MIPPTTPPGTQIVANKDAYEGTMAELRRGQLFHVDRIVEVRSFFGLFSEIGVTVVEKDHGKIDKCPDCGELHDTFWSYPLAMFDLPVLPKEILELQNVAQIVTDPAKVPEKV